MQTSNLRTVILIPCYNESAALATVIQDFKTELPQAHIYVYDNGSTDNTVAVALDNGAFVRHVSIRGKGQVVRRMFADIEADVYVLVDGDATYDAKRVHEAISMLETNSLDMVVCTRTPNAAAAFRPGHAIGNKLFTHTVNLLFRREFSDIFSGYRIFSRRFVKSFPAISQKFDIEAEMTIHALQLGIPSGEIATDYSERPKGSQSKLNTIKDGFSIMRTVLLLFLYVRPMAFFGFLFLIFASISLILGAPIVIDFIQTGYVPRLPTAVLAASFSILSAISLVCGIILDSISRSRLEAKRCWYLLANANNR